MGLSMEVLLVSVEARNMAVLLRSGAKRRGERSGMLGFGKGMEFSDVKLRLAGRRRYGCGRLAPQKRNRRSRWLALLGLGYGLWRMS